MTIGNTVAKLAGKALRPVRAGEKKLAEAGMSASAPVMEVSSPAFGDGERIPERYSSSEGENLSPPLRWSGVPEGTAELAIICEDPDAPMPSAFVHWTLYHIPPALHELPEGAHPGPSLPAVEGKNSSRKDGYTGPVPPRGHGVHHYHFQVFALDAPIRLGPHASRDELVKAMEGHVLAVGETVGTYERN